ncbi:DUF1917-domain-containing protein [Lindgomyces ingoldianus]|uniref:DUF1917-domain-containing protein n=1 Tax=Lindgomyces ingoldianus TaxID=673940 RepID=A0ACB6RHG6_9PLEO|nr:DUF1917-domain-containing protein [Lindgomyces ingoldianus]KAF2477957.1 DUF1917-domain-containing protein [Lindgomyces ingoldianus]
MSPSDLHNIYQGKPDAWQLGESVDDFVRRLPPLTTPVAVCPWIWAANPYRNGQRTSGRAKTLELVQSGAELLQQSKQRRMEIEQKHSRESKGAVARMLSQEADRLKQQIVDLAQKTNVTEGKWMLFPSLEDLGRVWKLVVEGTISNRLGSGAKVATDEGGTEPRLICIYTKDFGDTKDVLRVLQELEGMGLVGFGRGISYKADIYTYLNIYRQNAAEYGLWASIYSSQKMLAKTRVPEPNAIPQKEHSTPDAFRECSEPMDLD